jgi:hypothetical protein
MNCTLASSVIKSMEFSNGLLTIVFPKYTKKYYNVPVLVAYQLAYSNSPLATFNSLIKNKFKAEKV